MEPGHACVSFLRLELKASLKEMQLRCKGRPCCQGALPRVFSQGLEPTTFLGPWSAQWGFGRHSWHLGTGQQVKPGGHFNSF